MIVSYSTYRLEDVPYIILMCVLCLIYIPPYYSQIAILESPNANEEGGGEIQAYSFEAKTQIWNRLTVEGLIIKAVPYDACSPVKPLDISISKSDSINEKGILIASSANCNMVRKLHVAQRGGYSGLIIYNEQTNSTEPTTDDHKYTHHDFYNEGISYCGFIGQHDGFLIKSNFTNAKNRPVYKMRIKAKTRIQISILWWLLYFDLPKTLLDNYIYDHKARSKNSYLYETKYIEQLRMEFAMAVIIFAFLAYDRSMYIYRRYRRLTMRIFRADSCPICQNPMEDEQERILRCGHCFHATCINLWVVTNGNHVCPLCRTRVRRGDEGFENL